MLVSGYFAKSVGKKCELGRCASIGVQYLFFLKPTTIMPQVAMASSMYPLDCGSAGSVNLRREQQEW